MWWQISSAVLGVWLMFAPAALGHVGTTLADLDRTVGPLVASVSFVAAAQITRSVRWLNLAFAGVLVVAAWFVEAPTASQVNSAVVALAILALTPWGSPNQRRYGNGWTTIWRVEDLPEWDAPRADESAA